MNRKTFFLICCVVLTVAAADAATYLVPTDRDLARRATAIVVATAIESHAERTDGGGIVTVTSFAIDEQLKGAPLAAADVEEPGGSLDGRIVMIPGVPRFTAGARYVLFLHPLSGKRFTTYGLALGAFAFVGANVTRDAPGFDESDGSPHVDKERDAHAFVGFIRRVAQSPDAPVAESYASAAAPAATIPFAAYTRYDYMFDTHLRWQNNATASFGYCCAPTFESNFDGPGAASVAANLWNATGVIHYSIAGASTATSGLLGHDGQNTILFEDPNNELSRFGSGVIAIGGITNSAGSYQLDGQSFIATAEADIVVGKGARFAGTLSQAAFTATLAHEMGHTLGFRHADGTGDPGSPQNGNGCAQPLPCSSGGQALMESVISRSTLGQWDIDAANTVYGAACATTLTSVTANPTVALPGQSITLATNASTTSGSLSYQWFRGALDVNPIGTGQSITVSETATTTYFVRVASSCGGPAQIGQVTVNLNTGACGANANQLCINNTRYRVTLTASDPTGKTAPGVAVYQSNVFGYFSLPDFTGDRGNPEVFVKIVEPSPGNPWVFYAGLTNLDYTMNVTDTQGPFTRSYHVAAPPAGSFQSFGNFDVNGASSTSCANVIVSAGQTTAGSCANTSATLCLLNRFSISLQAHDNPTRSNNGGAGAAVAVNSVFGFFTTPVLSPDPNDIQAFVKMVDARTLDGHFWVFLGGLTDFELLMTVTDTQTGRQKIYLKPAGSTCGWNDTTAFQ